MVEKLEELYMLDDTACDFAHYVVFRLREYDSEKDCFQSFDDYVEFCLHMVKEDI